MKIAGIEITHPDKIIFAKAKITKGDMAQYYEKIADRMLPFLKDRPLTLHRFPDGINKEGFYQKNAADYFPGFVKTVKIKTGEGQNTQVYCNTTKSLLYLVNQGTVGFHIWLARRDKLHKPDKVILDLDPPSGGFEKVKKAAQIVGDYFREKGEKPNLMTTGQNGFHVWYSVRRTKTFDQIREALRSHADKLAEAHPDLLTTSVRIDGREGKVFIDYLRNAYGQTAVCPWSLRPNTAAGVAKPITWKELGKIESADAFTWKSVMDE